MEQKAFVLGIIPARGGSKSIPKKNLVPLKGKPLILYTFEAARQSSALQRCILSTDDPEIAKLGEKHGVQVLARPESLAKDDTPMVEVVKHVIASLEREGLLPDYFVLLQPTSPLREGRHIDESVSIFLQDPTADSVVSVVAIPHLFHPQSALKIEKGRLVRFYAEGKLFARRQDKPPCFARNGPVVVVFKRSTVERFNNLYGEHSLPYHMSEEDSIDIDTPLDLILVEAIMRGKKSKKQPSPFQI